MAGRVEPRTAQARRILFHWAGMYDGLHPEDVAWLEHRAEPGESLLATCAREARVNIEGVQPFDHREMSRRIAMAEAADPVVHFPGSSS